MNSSRRLRRYSLLSDADLLADRGDGIADLADNALQLDLCDFQMLRPPENGRRIIHRNLAPAGSPSA
jgi:hypothetical protein